MKFLFVLCYALLFSLSAFAEPEVDLDSAFLNATAPSLSFSADFSRGWDGSGSFPPIVKQSPFGACQSFSMTAFMEYLFFRETGKTLKLSEKFMAHSLLKLMIEDLWNKEKSSFENKPSLGLGIAPYMIETVHRAGLMPNADYQWGEFDSAEGSRSLDFALFDKVFENPERVYTKEEYERFLEESFLSAPPKFFRYSYKSLNFKTGKEEDVLLRSPSDLKEAAGVDKTRFLVLNNSEMNPFYHPKKPEDIKGMLQFFELTANHFGVRNETVTGAKITESIVKSLNDRMVVLVASDVWSGSWTDKLLDAGGGGHAMVIVGYQYRDGELYFKIRNSWGKEKGVDGYNFIAAALLQPNIYYVMLYR